jgi:hypothetical protein
MALALLWWLSSLLALTGLVATSPARALPALRAAAVLSPLIAGVAVACALTT